MRKVILKIKRRKSVNANVFITGSSGHGRMIRSFSEDVFDPKLVPNYVTKIWVIYNPKNDKKYFCYSDDYCRLTRRQLTANKQQANKKEPLEVIADRTRRYSGMSFLVKQNNIEQLLKNGDRIYVIDPEDEYMKYLNGRD